MTIKSSSYLLLKFSRVPLTIVLIPLFSTIVNSTLLNFGKRYEYDLRVTFDQCQELHLGFGCAKQSKNLEWYLLFTCLAAIPRSTDLILSSTSPILTKVSDSCFSRSNLAVLTSSVRRSKALSHRSF
jgi:hypothetical protein